MSRISTFLAALALVLSQFPAAYAEVPKPAVKIEKPGTQCVAPPEEMRRNHMEMLKHQRNRTMRNGERGAKVSLNGCIECHTSQANGAVTGGHDNFCQSCHSYVAVKLDCWDCHQPKAGYKATGAMPSGEHQ